MRWPIATAVMAAGLIVAATATSPAARPLRSQDDAFFAWTLPLDPGLFDIGRNGPCTVYDSRRDRTLAIAGGVGVYMINTYIYPQGIVVIDSTAEPLAYLVDVIPGPETTQASAVYDSLADAVWVYGGITNVVTPGKHGYTPYLYGNLWKFDVAAGTWSVISQSGNLPTPGWAAAMILDPVRRRLVLFGGVDSLGGRVTGTFTMDLATPGVWQRLSFAGPEPSPRAFHFAAYDAVADRMVMVGGTGPVGEPTPDAWTLSLSGTPAWQPLSTSGTPAGGVVVGILDPGRARIVTIGDSVRTLDLASSSWTTRSTLWPQDPANFYAESAAYDRSRDRMVVTWEGGFTSYPPPHPAAVRQTALLNFQPLPSRPIVATPTPPVWNGRDLTLGWNLTIPPALWTDVRLEQRTPQGYVVLEPREPVAGLNQFVVRSVPPSDTLHFRLHWFEGDRDNSSEQTIVDSIGQPAPPPLTLDIRADTLWVGSNVAHVQFFVPDDSARMNTQQALERQASHAGWVTLYSGMPDASGHWSYDDGPVTPFVTYDYRLCWQSPAGEACGPVQSIVAPGPPTLSFQMAYANHVDLAWTTAPGVRLDGVVRFDHGAGPESTVVHADDQGQLHCSDSGVAPDHDYTYQLWWRDGGLLRAEAPIDVHTPSGPSTLTFALGRPAPNPAADAFRIDTTVPGSAAGRLEILDLAGRVRVTRSVPPGVQTLDVETRGLESGLYFVRLRAGSTRQTRLAILR